jgi:CheY-like chemotaxis protein
LAELANFRQCNFGEQMNTLIRIGQEKDFSAFDGLFELFLSPLGDRAVDEMVQHTLRDLLRDNEPETIKRLSMDNPRVKQLCLLVVGMQKFESAVPLLPKMAKREKDPKLLSEFLNTMSTLKKPGFLPTFKQYLDHPDELVSAISIKMMGEYKDESSVPELKKRVEAGEELEQIETCSLIMGQSILSLAEIGTDEVIEFFVKCIHHKNPTARRMIHEIMVEMGPVTVPFIAAVYDGHDVDEKILAGNVLGLIGDKKGGDVMVKALDKGKAEHPNIKFAIYEAFGNIKSMKSLICLADALEEQDELILMAVITSLDKQLNPIVAEKINALILKGDEHSNRLLETISAARAGTIFSFLYEEGTSGTAEALIKAVAKSDDQETRSYFIGLLETLAGEKTKEHVQLLKAAVKEKTGAKVMAVDDSRSILSFYRSALSKMGFQVYTAVNGRKALDILESGEMVELIITDMNMPVMDGIELTRKVRENIIFKNIPIIMVTTESESSQQQLACCAGVNHFLMKPLKIDSFTEKIKSVYSHESI